jgi:hypothetical protein
MTCISVMPKAFIFCPMVLFTLTTQPQKLERIVITGSSTYWQSLMREIYRYPSFYSGIMNYKNGESYSGLMNYHGGLDQLQSYMTGTRLGLPIIMK